MDAQLFQSAFIMKSSLPPLMPNAALRWDMVSRSLPHPLGNVLEIGCGQGAFAARIAPQAASYTALEPDKVSYEIARARVGNSGTVLNATSQDLDPARKFDLVCAFEVLEHFSDDGAALEDWVSRLKPGGALMISVPAHSDRFGAWDEAVGHFRRYDRSDLEDLFLSAGLTNNNIFHFGFPGGNILESLRNLIATKKLKAPTSNLNFADRTAQSGRILQFAHGMPGVFVAAASLPLIGLQRLFLDKGVAMIGIGIKPE